MFERFEISAPGSIMLMGEHAVLHGSRAVVCAVNRRLRMRVRPRVDPVLRIQSALGVYESPLRDLEPVHLFRFMLEGLRGMELSCGLEIVVESEFSDQVGLGSSAAVSVCTRMARQHLEKQAPSLDAVLRSARADIRHIQGRGSGADAAASVFGGLLAYRPDPPEVHTLSTPLELVLSYAGYKTPTPEVIQRVDERFREEPDRVKRLYCRMANETECGIEALFRGDREAWAVSVKGYQDAMRELGVSDPVLERMIARLEAQNGVRAAKISGSGLGDCVVGFGQTDPPIEGESLIHVAVEPEGVRFE